MMASVLVAVSGAAQASDSPPSDPRATAEALFARAQGEDQAGDYAHAVIDYRASVSTFAGFSHAPKANTRASVLEAHREGDWIPFRELETVRRDPAASSDATAIDTLARAIPSFPPGPTRSEAWMVCANAYLSRLNRRAEGEAALRSVTSDALADGLVRREAASLLVGALIADRNLDLARTTARELGNTLDAKEAQHVEALVRRRRLHVAAVIDLALFAVLTAGAVLRSVARGNHRDVVAALRRFLPLGVGFVAYVALIGGLLASQYEAGNSAPFIAFGCALALILVAARAWGVAGSASRGARIGRAIVSGTAVAAAAFLVLESINGQYLEGFSL